MEVERKRFYELELEDRLRDFVFISNLVEFIVLKRRKGKNYKFECVLYGFRKLFFLLLVLF